MRRGRTGPIRGLGPAFAAFAPSGVVWGLSYVFLFEAFALMSPGAPFVQFTYNAVAPIPKRLDRVSVEASERVWMNIPPARVWVYRRD